MRARRGTGTTARRAGFTDHRVICTRISAVNPAPPVDVPEMVVTASHEGGGQPMVLHDTAPPPRELGRHQGIRCALVALDCGQAEALVRRLGAYGIGFDPVCTWGDHNGYARIQLRRPVLIALDAGAVPNPADVLWHVRVLRRFGPVLVFAHNIDGAPLLDAGAHDVLERESAPAEITARIRAHLRRLAPGQSAAATPDPPRRSSTQGFLLRWLQTTSRAFCCHELRHLLAPPHHPLSLPALRRRMHRIRPLLARHGLRLHEVSTPGFVRYRVAALHPAEAFDQTDPGSAVVDG
jgi:hypothetical protein